jgi:SAM-dependent methyltransferase
LCKVFIRPWLDFQTRYNHGVIESLAGQVAVRRQSEAATAARQDKSDALAAELREQVLQVRAELADLLAAHRLTNSRLGEVSAALRQAKAELAAVRKTSRERGEGEPADGALRLTPPPGVRTPTAAVTERVLEHLSARGGLPRPPARVLDLGCAESGASAELAGLGYRVVGVDVRRLPLEHPNFTQVQATLGDLPFADGSFDVAVRLTAVEPAALGWSTKGDVTGDERAVREAVRTLKAGGTFVLTVPFGRGTITPPHRVYDRSQLDTLLAPLRVREVAFGVRDGESWAMTATEATAARADSSERVSAIALVVAEKL